MHTYFQREKIATCSPNDNCDICDAMHKTSKSIKWCSKCDEKLCVSFQTIHSVSKSLKHHTLIEIRHYRKLPDSALDIKSFCDQHEMKTPTSAQSTTSYAALHVFLARVITVKQRVLAFRGYCPESKDINSSPVC